MNFRCIKPLNVGGSVCYCGLAYPIHYVFQISRTLGLNQRQFCPPADIWQCLETLLVAISRGGGGSNGIQWVEAKFSAKHSTVHMTMPHTENHPFQNDYGAVGANPALES